MHVLIITSLTWRIPKPWFSMNRRISALCSIASGFMIARVRSTNIAGCSMKVAGISIFCLILTLDLLGVKNVYILSIGTK